jgi:hypothetical protein
MGRRLRSSSCPDDPRSRTQTASHPTPRLVDIPAQHATNPARSPLQTSPARRAMTPVRSVQRAFPCLPHSGPSPPSYALLRRVCVSMTLGILRLLVCCGTPLPGHPRRRPSLPSVAGSAGRCSCSGRTGTSPSTQRHGAIEQEPCLEWCCHRGAAPGRVPAAPPRPTWATCAWNTLTAYLSHPARSLSWYSMSKEALRGSWKPKRTWGLSMPMSNTDVPPCLLPHPAYRPSRPAPAILSQSCILEAE